MKYLTALPVFLALFLFDVAILVLCIPLLGLLLVDMLKGEFPVSYKFALRIWT